MTTRIFSPREIGSFATHVGYLDQGRLRFTEEMGAVSQRFREIEVVLDGPAELLRDLPPAWLNPDRSSTVVRFTHSQYEPRATGAEIRQQFHGIREITVRNIPLRSIFMALAKSARGSDSGR